jgi:inhibitor of KinA
MVTLMEITPLGDSALIVRVCDKLDDDPALASDRVLEALRRLEVARIPGVIELAPAYTTVALFFDPVRVTEAGAPVNAVEEWLADRVRTAMTNNIDPGTDTLQPRLVHIPICYGGKHGPDLDDVARYTGFSPEEVVQRHSTAEYHVHCIGFSPGFPYLGGLPSELAVPRRATPRKNVPAGSVGIGGAQTGIYPLSSPGGWHLIGRTPAQLFSVEADPPSLLRAGDRVRFIAMPREEFKAWTE